MVVQRMVVLKMIFNTKNVLKHNRDQKFRLHRRLYVAPIYVPCVQFCNGRGKAAKNVGFTGSFPIAKLDTNT